MKKQIILSLLLSSLITINGCSNQSNNSSSVISSTSSSSSLIYSSSTTKELPADAQEFVEAVNNIVLNESAIIAIDEAFDLYELLEDWNYPEVLEAYYKLCYLEEVYNEYIELSNSAQNFIERVAEIPYILKLSDERYIISAEDAYENLNEEEKNILGVEQAYARLLKSREAYDVLYLESLEKERQDTIDSFVNLVNELPSVEEFTVDDYEKVLEAKENYENLPKDIQEEQIITESYNKVIELYNQYNTIIKLIITLDPNGGNCDIEKIDAVANEEIGTLPTPTLNGYHFLGWYTALENGEKVTNTSTFKASTTIYALWKEIVNVTITLDPNGGNVSQTEINTTNEKEIGILPTPTLEGYRFLGWYTALENGTKVTSNMIFDQALTLYALWENESIVHYVELEGAYLDTYMDNHARILWKTNNMGTISNSMSFTITINYNGVNYSARAIDWLNNYNGSGYSGIGFFKDQCPANLQKDEYTVTLTTANINGTIYSCEIHHPAS